MNLRLNETVIALLLSWALAATHVNLFAQSDASSQRFGKLEREIRKELDESLAKFKPLGSEPTIAPPRFGY